MLIRFETSTVEIKDYALHDKEENGEIVTHIVFRDFTGKAIPMVHGSSECMKEIFEEIWNCKDGCYDMEEALERMRKKYDS